MLIVVHKIHKYKFFFSFFAALRDTILRTLRSINVDGSSGSGSNRILSDISSTDSSCANQIVSKILIDLNV